MDVELRDFRALHDYSCEQPGTFWRQLWGYAGIVGDPGDRDVVGDEFADTAFFPGGNVDVAATMLAGDLDEIVVIQSDEAGVSERLSRRDLRDRTAALAATFRDVGVAEGDVVAAYATTRVSTLVSMLAAAACGAVFTSVSAEFGVDSVVDRFDQVQPKVLFAVDGYLFGGRRFDTRERVQDIVERIESITAVVVAAEAGVAERLAAEASREVEWFDYSAVVSSTTNLVTQSVAFNAPGWILYSSGTTGRPKCIVHRAGGVVLKHLSEQLLHCDIRPGDRVLYFTTPSWMMWNWLVSALAASACVVLYDGSPLPADRTHLLDIADREGVTYFGTSPSYLEALRQDEPAASLGYELSSLRTVGVTGAPLSPVTARFARDLGGGVNVLSKSGGTDLCGGLLTGDPTGAVWPGEIQAPAMGCAIAIVDDDGRDVEPGTTGELVSRTPFPSMPLRFVGDDEGVRLDQTYYRRFPGCWHQADFVSETEHGGYVVHGRSDTTLNLHGVRIGTAEIYARLAALHWIRSAVAVEYRQVEPAQLALLVELEPAVELNHDREYEIRQLLRTRCSPRHVPHVIEHVDALPLTANGKVSEVAARDALNGEQLRAGQVVVNPDSLDAIRAIGERLRAG